MKSQLSEVRAGRFSARFAFHDEPEVLERLEHLAAEGATSSASLVRLALRAVPSGLREDRDTDVTRFIVGASDVFESVVLDSRLGISPPHRDRDSSNRRGR